MSTEQTDLEIGKSYIKELVNLIAYPNIRVQFQSAWGLANLALGIIIIIIIVFLLIIFITYYLFIVDDKARMQIHRDGGTQKLFEWYPEMEKVVQLETLAAMVSFFSCFKS